MKTYKTAPFDLKKALAGHPLVNRADDDVTDFAKRNKEGYDGLNAHTDTFPYSARDSAGHRISLTAKGRYMQKGDSPCDIFLKIPIAKRSHKKKPAPKAITQPITHPITFPLFLPKDTRISWGTTREDYLAGHAGRQCIPVDHPTEWLGINSGFPLLVRSYPASYTPPQGKLEVMDGKLWDVTTGNGKSAAKNGDEVSSDGANWTPAIAYKYDLPTVPALTYRRPFPSAGNQFVVATAEESSSVEIAAQNRASVMPEIPTIRKSLIAQSDPVNHPAHYTSGGIECIDAIREALGMEGFKAFCRGNVIKYSWRADKKSNQAEDMAKAAWYADRAAGAEKL